jgi:hypothetical protein
VSTHPKYSASKDLHYIWNIFKGGCICGLGCRNARKEGESLVLSKTSIFNNFRQSCSIRRVQNNIM